MQLREHSVLLTKVVYSLCLLQLRLETWILKTESLCVLSHAKKQEEKAKTVVFQLNYIRSTILEELKMQVSFLLNVPQSLRMVIASQEALVSIMIIKLKAGRKSLRQFTRRMAKFSFKFGMPAELLIQSKSVAEHLYHHLQ